MPTQDDNGGDNKEVNRRYCHAALLGLSKPCSAHRLLIG